INPHTPEETEATVRKVWIDSDDQDGVRPESITVQLMADGEAYGEPVELNEENSWTVTVTGLPKNKDGNEITYTWEEIDVPAGYVLSGSTTEGKVTTLTNTYVPEEIELKGVKIWAGETDKDNQRPASVTIRLYVDGIEIDHVVVTAETDWTFKFSGLKKYKDGVEIKYTISEDPVAGYSTSIDGTKVTNTWIPPHEDPPQTSDRAVFPAVAMLLASVSGIVFTVTRRRKRNHA
ncbi:MAG: Cna B-type domain-containing protein, partial [Clostridia bacterium]|nr:Cna B-type domain-containing protein [Clostridia bacterium]